MVRRVLSLAPLRPAEALGLTAGGLGLWVVAIVTPAPLGSPPWAGWALAALAVVTALRGLIGIVGAYGAFLRGLLRRPGWPGNRAPRTVAETEEVRARRPPGWEYLYFAGCLFTERSALERAFLDHELRFAEPTGEKVDEEDAVDFLRASLNQVIGSIASLMALMASDAQERAFGPPGQEGDPERIRHLAERWSSVYRDLMRWAGRLRAVSKPDKYRDLFERTARLIDGPVAQYRDFVEAFVREADRIPGALRSHRPLVIDLELALSVDELAQEELQKEIDRMAQLAGLGSQPDILTGEPEERREDRESIQHDARRLSTIYTAMARLNGIEDTPGDERLRLKGRVDAIRDRLDAHRQAWGTTPRGPGGFVHEESGQGPLWLRSMVKDLDYLVWQLDEEG